MSGVVFLRPNHEDFSNPNHMVLLGITEVNEKRDLEREKFKHLQTLDESLRKIGLICFENCPNLSGKLPLRKLRFRHCFTIQKSTLFEAYRGFNSCHLFPDCQFTVLVQSYGSHSVVFRAKALINSL